MFGQIQEIHLQVLHFLLHSQSLSRVAQVNPAVLEVCKEDGSEEEGEKKGEDCMERTGILGVRAQMRHQPEQLQDLQNCPWFCVCDLKRNSFPRDPKLNAP